MSKRIAAHLRRNVYGLLALFFALSGTAIALDGQNTVFTDDITNGEVGRWTSSTGRWCRPTSGTRPSAGPTSGTTA